MSWKNDPNKRAMILVRRSSKGQDENTSADTQLKGAVKYISEYGLVEAGRSIITETAFISDDRTKYKKVMRDSIKAGIKHYIFYTSSRETRNHVDASWTESLIREDKIIIHYISDHRVFWKGTPDADWLMRDFQTTLNAHSSRETSTRVKDAYQSKIAKGVYPFCWVALGYRHQKDQDSFGNPIKGTSKLIIDPTEAKVKLVQKEFFLRAQGLSYDQIREAVLRDNLVPESLIRTYNRSSIQRRLNNKLYWGKIHEKKSGVVHEGNHPLIIDSHTLKIVDLVNSGQNRKGIRPKPLDHDGGHLRNFFRCGNPACGCLVTYEAHEKQYRKSGNKKLYDLYRCTNSKNIHEQKRYLNENDLWNIIDFAFASFEVSDDTAFKLSTCLAERQHFQSADLKKDIKLVKKKLIDVAEQRIKTVELLRTDQIIKRDFDQQITLLSSQEIKLALSLQDLEASLKKFSNISVEAIKELSSSFSQIWQTMSRAEKGPLLRSVAEAATLTHMPLTDSIEIRVDFKSHFLSLTGWRSIRSFQAKKNKPT